MALTKTKKRKRRPDQFQSKALSTKKITREDFSLEQVKAFANLLFFDHKIYQEYLANSNGILIGFDEVGRGSIAGPVCTGAYSCSTFYKNPHDLVQEIRLARQIISDQLLTTNDRDSYYAETLCNDLDVADDLDQVSYLSALLNLEDSKKVPKIKRETLTEALIHVPCLDQDSHLYYAINFESALTIDEIGIVESIWTSMTKNLINIINQYEIMNGYLPEKIILLVDGPKIIKDLEDKIRILKEEYLEIKFLQIAIKKGDSKSSLIAAGANLAKLARDRHMTEISLKHNDYGWANNAGYGTERHYLAINKYGITKEHRKSYMQNFDLE